MLHAVGDVGDESFHHKALTPNMFRKMDDGFALTPFGNQAARSVDYCTHILTEAVVVVYKVWVSRPYHTKKQKHL